MKAYEAPSLIRVKLNPQEAYNTNYSNCVLGETHLLEQGTNCMEINSPWNDASYYQCYLTPTV